MTQQDMCMIIPPGGPSGPFWGVVRQSGLIIATQIQERETAVLLAVILNIIDGDFDTIEAIGKEFKSLDLFLNKMGYIDCSVFQRATI